MLAAQWALRASYNLNPDILRALATAYGEAISPEDLFDAILALLSATSYSVRFAEDLEDTFPHIPFPADPSLFHRAVAIGRCAATTTMAG